MATYWLWQHISHGNILVMGKILVYILPKGSSHKRKEVCRLVNSVRAALYACLYIGSIRITDGMPERRSF